jgi:hypothetical protein
MISGGGRVRHTLRLTFDEFGWQSLESEAGGDGQALDELIVRVVAYFDAELRTTRRALLAPWFKPSGRGTPREIEFKLSAASERLGSEASRQGIPLERLLEHASLFYLANLDSGRVADRILGRAQRDDDRSRAGVSERG